MKCGICGVALANSNGLSTHIRKKHTDMSQEDYYLNCINPSASFLCSCGKRKRFLGFWKGYLASCGNKECAKKSFNSNVTKTSLEKYGVSHPSKSRTMQEKRKETFRIRATAKPPIDKI